MKKLSYLTKKINQMPLKIITILRIIIEIIFFKQIMKKSSFFKSYFCIFENPETRNRTRFFENQNPKPAFSKPGPVLKSLVQTRSFGLEGHSKSTDFYFSLYF